MYHYFDTSQLSHSLKEFRNYVRTVVVHSLHETRILSDRSRSSTYCKTTQIYSKGVIEQLLTFMYYRCNVSFTFMHKIQLTLPLVLLLSKQ